MIHPHKRPYGTHQNTIPTNPTTQKRSDPLPGRSKESSSRATRSKHQFYLAGSEPSTSPFVISKGASEPETRSRPSAGAGIDLLLSSLLLQGSWFPRWYGGKPAWAVWGSGRLEIACVDRDGGVIIDTSVDPGVPISREAALIHGITDADVRGKPGVHGVMDELEQLLEQHGLIASRNVRFTRTALNSSLGRERIGFHRPMTMCAMKTYAGFRSEMNPATGEHAWASLAQIELYVDPDQQGDTHRQERRLTGLLEALPSEVNRAVEADALAREVLSASGIEGEILDPDQVRSCVAARLGLDAGKSLRPIPAVEGIVSIMVDATARYWEGLTEERLLGWHSWLFPQGRNGLRRVRGRSLAYRADTGHLRAVGTGTDPPREPGAGAGPGRDERLPGMVQQTAGDRRRDPGCDRPTVVLRHAPVRGWERPNRTGHHRHGPGPVPKQPHAPLQHVAPDPPGETRTAATSREPPWKPRGPATSPPGSAGSPGASARPWTMPWRRCLWRSRTPP